MPDVEDDDLDDTMLETPEFRAWWAAYQKEHEEYRRKENERHKRWRKNNPEKLRKRWHKNDLKQRYNLTIEEYDVLLETQGGCCAICKTNNPRGPGRFHVDHDHNTGKIRGLLCTICNFMIANHSPERLREAADYVEYWRHQHYLEK